jgi:hypothetical protein
MGSCLHAYWFDLNWIIICGGLNNRSVPCFWESTSNWSNIKWKRCPSVQDLASAASWKGTSSPLLLLELSVFFLCESGLIQYSIVRSEPQVFTFDVWKKRKLRVRPGNVSCVCFVFDTNFSLPLSLYDLVIFVLVGKMIGQWTHIGSTTQAKWCPGDTELLSTILQQLCEGPWWSWTLWPVRIPAFGLETFTGGAG